MVDRPVVDSWPFLIMSGFRPDRMPSILRDTWMGVISIDMNRTFAPADQASRAMYSRA